jgi:hypothetical protein
LKFGTFRSLSDPSLGVGSKKDRVVGTATDELDQTSDEVASILEFGQSHASVNDLLFK